VKTKVYRYLVLLYTVILALIWLMPTVTRADNPVVTVEWNNEKQVMDGIGGSCAFNKAVPLLKFSQTMPEVAEELLDMIFDEEKGIGLDIVRVIIGDGGIIEPATGAEWGNRWYDGPSDTIWPHEDSGFVWDMDNWEEIKPNFDRAQIYYMKEAQKRGVKTFYATAWSPPYWMKKSMSVMGQNAHGQPPELKDDVDENGRKKYYQAYADYLVEYVIGYKREFDIEITHICPVNESEAQHGYSGIVLRGDAFKEFIESYLGPAIKRAEEQGRFAEVGMSAPKLVAPETTNLSALSYYVSTMNNINPDTGRHDYIDVFSTHLYGSANVFNNGPATAGTGQYPAYVRYYDRIWQTEYMTQSGRSDAAQPTQIYSNQTIDDGLYWTRFISNTLTSDPGFNAYLWWWPVANNGADGSDLIRLCHSGQPQGIGETTNGLYRVFKRFYTIGQISRFIDPGYIRIEATRAPVSGVTIIAYKAPDGNDFSIVVTNEASADVTLDFDLKDFPAGITGMTAFRTSSSENHKKLTGIAVNNKKFTATIPAKSVVTFVPENGEKAKLPGLNHKRDIFSNLQAEDNDGTNADIVVSNGAVYGLGNNDYIKFANINFADGSANGGIVRRHILSMTAVVAPIDGGLLEVRVGSPTGKVVGTFNIPPGNGQFKSYTIQVDTGDLGAYGTNVDIYVVARGIGNNMFGIDRFDFGETYIQPQTVLVNGGFDTNKTTPWVPFGTATLSTTGNQLYSAPTLPASTTNAYSLLISERENGSGAAQDITGKLINGETYRVNAFVMPTISNTTATIKLVGTNADGNMVYEKTIATRRNLAPMVWSQVDGVFKCDIPEEVQSLMLVISNDSNKDMYLEEITLVPQADKEELLIVLNAEYNRELYSDEEWNAIEQAIADGKTLLTTADASQRDIDGVIGVLTSFAPYDLHLECDKGIVRKDDYFNIITKLNTNLNSNTIAITYLFDGTKFRYRGFTPAEGLSILNSKIEDGKVTFILAKLAGYGIKDIGKALFSPKEDVVLGNGYSSMEASVDVVVQDDTGEKEIRKAYGTIEFKTGTELAGDTNADGVIDLIDLSNIIDYFGVTQEDSEWREAEFYDFNNNGEIDIADIVVVAKAIQL